jgi:hypothetical protein
MRWFRSHRRPWAWMALLALVIQFGLAFGHVHPIHAAQNAPVASAAGTSDPTSGDPDDNDYCATCAIMALLTGAQTASPPAVAPPVMLGSAEITIASEAARIDSSRAAFRSRAPPLS